MNKLGFTLIELLAVIVILAIILLIATPVITGVIESSRKNAFDSSAKIIMKSAETEYLSRVIASNQGEVVYVFDGEGNQTVEPEEVPKLEVNIDDRIEGYVKVYEDGTLEIALTDGKNYVSKDKDTEISNVVDYTDQVLAPVIEVTEVTPKADVWLESFVDPNDGYLTLAPAINSNNYDWGTSYATTLGGVSINAITDGGETYYLITNAAQFNAIRSNLNGKYIQMNDITISSFLSPIGSTVGSEWQSVPFTGYYNGRGFQLIIESMSTSYVGADWALFPKTDGAELIGMDVLYPNGYYAGTPLHRGGLVGRALNTTISQSSVRVSFAEGIAQTSIGGLVGYADDTKITDCYFIGDLEVRLMSYDIMGVGGLVGIAVNNSLIERTYAVATLPTEYNNYSISEYQAAINTDLEFIYIGGIVGHKDQSSILRESYFNSTTHSLTYRGYGLGRNEDFLKNINNFTEFGLFQGL